MTVTAARRAAAGDRRGVAGRPGAVRSPRVLPGTVDGSTAAPHITDAPTHRPRGRRSDRDRRRARDQPVQAVILVGGKGTRLRPLTLSAPKPMLPTAGVPFLTHMLSRIAAAGITDVVLGTSFKAEVFEQHFGTGPLSGCRSRMSPRPSRWGRAAASATSSRR